MQLDSNPQPSHLSKYFTGNNLPLKLLRTFFVALNDNPKLFKKTLFQFFLYLYLNSLIQQQNCFDRHQHLLFINIFHEYLLKKPQAKNIH